MTSGDDAPAMGRVMVDSWLTAHRGQMPDAAWEKRRDEWTPEVSATAWERSLHERDAAQGAGDVVLVAVDDDGTLAGRTEGHPLDAGFSKFPGHLRSLRRPKSRGGTPYSPRPADHPQQRPDHQPQRAQSENRSGKAGQTGRFLAASSQTHDQKRPTHPRIPVRWIEVERRPSGRGAAEAWDPQVVPPSDRRRSTPNDGICLRCMQAANEPPRTTICHSWAKAERNPTIGVGRRAVRTLDAS